MRRPSLVLLLLLTIAQSWAQHDWENHHVLQLNREPARAYFLPFGLQPGDRTLSLNGSADGQKHQLNG